VFFLFLFFLKMDSSSSLLFLNNKFFYLNKDYMKNYLVYVIIELLCFIIKGSYC